jgi:hypothetical protein
VKHYVLRYTILFVLYGIRRNLQQWKESVIVPIYKKGDKMYCNNYQGISLLSTVYIILSNILLARLTQYVNEIIGGCHCGFHHNRCTMDQIFYVCQIPERKWEYNGTVQQLLMDFKKAYDSFKREVLYNILLKFRIPKKLVRLIKMCLKHSNEPLGSEKEAGYFLTS